MGGICQSSTLRCGRNWLCLQCVCHLASWSAMAEIMPGCVSCDGVTSIRCKHLMSHKVLCGMVSDCRQAVPPHDSLCDAFCQHWQSFPCSGRALAPQLSSLILCTLISTAQHGIGYHSTALRSAIHPCQCNTISHFLVSLQQMARALA